MTQLIVKKQISNEFLSIDGIGFINHQHLLELFNIKPQEVSASILEIGLTYHPKGVQLIGDNHWMTTYISGSVVSRLFNDPIHKHFFDGSITRLYTYSKVMDKLIAPAELESLERIVSGITSEFGLASVPPMMMLSEAMH